MVAPAPRGRLRRASPAAEVEEPRVGGKAQRTAYRAVAGDLKLAYAQFEEIAEDAAGSIGGARLAHSAGG